MKVRYIVEMDVNNSSHISDVLSQPDCECDSTTRKFVDIVDKLVFRVMDGASGKTIPANFINIAENGNGNLVCEIVINQNEIDTSALNKSNDSSNESIASEIIDIYQSGRLDDYIDEQNTINTRTLFSKIRSKKITSTKIMQKGLELLKKRGFVEIKTIRSPGKSGRPSQVIIFLNTLKKEV